jgi:hypothetical protein
MKLADQVGGVHRAQQRLALAHLTAPGVVVIHLDRVGEDGVSTLVRRRNLRGRLLHKLAQRCRTRNKRGTSLPSPHFMLSYFGFSYQAAEQARKRADPDDRLNAASRPAGSGRAPEALIRPSGSAQGWARSPY